MTESKLFMTSTMELKFPVGVQELERHLDASFDQMHAAQRSGKYVDAESLRLHIEEGKKELERRKLNEMQSRHSREDFQLERAHREQLDQFHNFWNNKLKEYNDEARRCQNEMLNRHNEELIHTKDELQKTLPIKYKESSQLLNLKRMEQHMAKQKNYVEAHKVQARVNLLDRQENEAWLNVRAIKIETALTQLRGKQANQLAALRKRILTGNDEQNKDRLRQQQRLIQKYNNVKAQLVAQHEKECLFFKGQFRSKVNVSKSSSGSKSKN